MNILRSIALQLLALESKNLEAVLPLYKAELDNYSSILHDPETAVKLVEALLLKQDRVHIVVDGLDECDESDRDWLFRTFSDLTSCKTYGIVKWFFTSRANHSRENA